MNSQLVVVGSLNADFVIQVARYPVPGETIVGRTFQVFPGGKGANQAYGAARLGATVSMIGQVGNDAQADWLIQNLHSAGVDASAVSRDAQVSSGIATITLNDQGQNQIIIVPGANGTFTPDRLALSQDRIARAGFVLLQLEIPLATVEAAARAAKAAGATLILDPAPAQALPDSLLDKVDYLTPNETELAILTQTSPALLNPKTAAALARTLVARGARKVIVKLGAQGALLVTAKAEYFWPALTAPVVDTTDAGDAFNAAFAAGLARGQSEIEAGHYATAAAACSVSRARAQPSMPTDAEVQALLRRG